MSLLTLGEASRYSGLSPRILKRAVADGRLPATRIDGWLYQIAPDDLASFSLASQVEEMSSSAAKRAFETARPRAAVASAAPASGFASLFRKVMAGLWPARVATARPGGTAK